MRCKAPPISSSPLPPDFRQFQDIAILVPKACYPWRTLQEVAILSLIQIAPTLRLMVQSPEASP
jgi:hypothetical protein